jgi:O-antigen biosynthesis protein
MDQTATSVTEAHAAARQGMAVDMAQRKLSRSALAETSATPRTEKCRDLEASVSRTAVVEALLPELSSDSEFDASRDFERGTEQGSLTFDRLPIMKTDASGRLSAGVAIDYWAYAGGVLLISGWVMGDDIKALCPGRTACSPGATASVFRRPDVEGAYPAFTAGILAVVTTDAVEHFSLFGFKLRFPVRREDDGNFDTFLTEHAQRFGFLLENLPEDTPLRAIVAARLQPAPETYKGARAFLEQTKGVPGHGGLAVGWAANLPGVRLCLIDPAGRIVPLARAIRWHRADIVQALGQDFGNYTFNAGLLQAWQHPFRTGDQITLAAFDGEAAFVLASSRWEAAPIEPVSFARWAFELPTPLDRFAERLELRDGAISESLIARDRRSWLTAAPEIHTFGPLVKDPKCSIVVPLYGRFDFMLNQMLEFSEDRQIKRHADLIYVVDDPRIASSVIQQGWLLYEANQIPFRVIVTPENRGFAGANNFGVSISRAPYLLLLNSDVVPVEPGWLAKMLAAIHKSPNIGVVGARLFFANGSIQHDGIMFQWEPSWNAFLNKHPRSGMEASTPQTKHVNDPAVTAACLLIRKSTYQAIGGLDEGYLIGDFEDSDLCLKVRKLGQEIVCLRDLNLTHLERQSFSGIGADGFRERVSRYNAWRHQRRWAKDIDKLVSEPAAGVAA